jgi:pimeloyl-ACP methyl ester carboxylesterase
MKKTRILSILSASALVSMLVVGIPSAAHAAAPQCDGKVPINSCQGATSDAAPYVMQVPANFNGTLVLYSHGYRPNIPVPAGIPGYGGYTVTNTPQPGPVVGGKDTSVIAYLLGHGFAVAGSGFARQGWNADSAIATDVELIGAFKTQFPKTTHVVAWGESLGGFITQGLAEKYPTLVDAVAPMCLADNVGAELTMAGDFLWGVKTLFDPTIKGGNYSAGAAGYAEAMGDMVKFFTVIGKLQAGISTGAWPDTSSATGKALAAAGVPSRSALLLLGLMAALKVTFPLAVSPALAILENGANAGALAILVLQDVENQAGGAIFDNTKTDYAARVSDDRVIFNAALSGNTVIDALLGALSPLNPGAPRAVGNAAAITKMNALQANTGKINVPTITMVGVADPITPAGSSVRIAQAFAQQYADEKAKAYSDYAKSREYNPPKKSLISLWSTTPAAYTTFTSAGAPITSTPAAPGTNHCNFTAAQYLVVAQELVSAGQTGKFLGGGTLNNLMRKANNLSNDPFFNAPLLKYYQ